MRCGSGPALSPFSKQSSQPLSHAMPTGTQKNPDLQENPDLQKNPDVQGNPDVDQNPSAEQNSGVGGKSSARRDRQPRSPETPQRIDPEKVRVVDIEEKETGELIRRDCYDPDGGVAEMGDVLRLKGGELYLRAIDWARSKSQSEKIVLKWEPTGLRKEEVGRIGVYTWPAGEPVRVFADQEAAGDQQAAVD